MRIVITGTSGVGKTYLETLLSQKFGFIPIPKYTDRPQRPGEVEGNGIHFLSSVQMAKRNKNNDFFFTLNYVGFLYGWMREDLEKYSDKNISIAITLESLSDLLKTNLDFIPILLTVDEQNFALLELRIKKQLDYNNLDAIKKKDADKIIEQRLKFAKEEIGNNKKYIEVVEKTEKGKVFKIKDDSTLANEILPYISSLKEQ